MQQWFMKTNKTKRHAWIVFFCVSVRVGQNARRLQTQEQQDQRRSVPLSHRHTEHVSQIPLSYFSYAAVLEKTTFNTLKDSSCYD